MKKILLVGFIIAAMVAPVMVSAQVETGNGSLQIGGKIKWLYIYRAENEDQKIGDGGFAGNYWNSSGDPVEQFATTSVEIDLVGTVGEKVSYLIELQASVGQGLYTAQWGPAGNGLQGAASSSDELIGSAIGVRQAVIAFTDIIPMTTVYVGTGNLPLGIYQPRATNDWDMINLPMFNTAILGGAGGVGGEYTPIGLGWQATGFMFAVKPIDMIELDLAMFNGYDNNVPNADQDLEKSGMINLKIMPVEGALISVGYLADGWLEGGWGHQTASVWIVSGGYQNNAFEVNFDYMQGVAEDYGVDDDLDLVDLNWMGYQVTAGWWVMDSLELLVRYEFLDPNLENDKDVGLSNYDDLTVATLGLNYRLAETAEVSVNYLFFMEAADGDKVDTGGTIPDVGGKYQQVDDDTLLIQVQVWQ